MFIIEEAIDVAADDEDWIALAADDAPDEFWCCNCWPSGDADDWFCVEEFGVDVERLTAKKLAINLYIF